MKPLSLNAFTIERAVSFFSFSEDDARYFAKSMTGIRKPESFTTVTKVLRQGRTPEKTRMDKRAEYMVV